MAKPVKDSKRVIVPVCKRTSIGRDGVPLNKHKRRSWKPYRGQGR